MTLHSLDPVDEALLDWAQSCVMTALRSAIGNKPVTQNDLVSAYETTEAMLQKALSLLTDSSHCSADRRTAFIREVFLVGYTITQREGKSPVGSP